MKRMEGSVCAKSVTNIGRWRWADRSLAFNWQHLPHTPAFLLCTLDAPSPSMYLLLLLFTCLSHAPRDLVP